MPPARLVAVLVLGVALLAIRPVTAAAQSELQAWLNPEMGKQIPRADYRYTFYPERKVEDQQTHFTMTEQRVTLFAPLYQDSTDEFAFAAKTLYQDIDTRARLPEAGGRFPSELWDASASVSYRHKFDNGWTGGVALTVGSGCEAHRAVLSPLDGSPGVPLSTGSGAPTSMVGRLDRDRFVIATGGCNAPSDLWIVQAASADPVGHITPAATAPVLLVRGVDAATLRQPEPTPPPPLPTPMPCPIACLQAKSFKTPACSASSKILSDAANVSVRGREVFRSSSRNWQRQPFESMKYM